MRQPQEARGRLGSQHSSSTSIPAPIGGLNGRDSVANMEATDAVMMENWFPSSTNVSIRKGYTAWNTFSGVCQTIMTYHGLTSTKVYACVNNSGVYSVYDATSAGALSSAVVGGGGATVEALGNTRFDYINFGTAGGQYLIAVNGTNNPIQFDGTTWTVSGLAGGTPANYQSITVYQKRIFVFSKNTFEVRYWAVETIAGASAAALNLGSLFKLGGHLAAIISLADDGGGLVDYIGFVSSEGEVIAYTGSDPSAAATWSLAAHFRIGRPVTVGNRTWCKWGTDALVLCADGVYPLRKAVQADRKVEGLSVSDKIRPLLANDIAIYGSKYGWTCMVYPTGDKLIVNVPTSEDVSSYQYVMNTQTGSWTKFTGWTAFCFEVAGETLYMGGKGTVVKADTTAQDGSSAILAKCRQSYNYFGRRGNQKHTKMMRPIFSSDGNYGLTIAADMDYKTTNPVVLRSITGGAGDPWGGIWDASWSGPAVTSLHWYGVNAVGHAIAPYVAVQVNGTSLNWSATDVVYEGGGIL